MDLQFFEKEYKIHVYETGPDGKLKLHSLFDFLQDIASEHAERLGFGRDDLMKNNHIWVLSRMYAEISEWPLWEDTIVVKTWHKGTDKLFGMRDFLIYYPDKRPIAAAVSSWLIIDRDTKKIQRPNSNLLSITQSVRLNALPRSAARLEPAGEGELSIPFRVKVSDLDVNHHTNNARYLNWATDTYNLGFLMKNEPYSAEINYLAESVYDDEIIIQKSVWNNNNSIYDHSIFNRSDNRELCRIRLTWKEIKNPKVN